MLWIIYNLLFPVVFICMLPKFVSRMLKRGGYGQHFEQRIGHFGHGTKERLRAHRRIWVHAVSVGEIYVALRFIKAWREAHPGTYFALSTTSSTGHAIAQKGIHSDDVLFYFPVDLPVVIKKVLRIVNPLQIILVEGELWPNLIRLADGQGIPISLINGRVSKSSYRGYMKIRPLTADILRRMRPIAMQGEEDAQRVIDMGAKPEAVHVLGTVKFDVAERNPEGEAAAREILKTVGVTEESIVLLGGSTWPGEERVLCELYKRLRQKYPQLFLVLVPRHVERADEIIKELEAQQLIYQRRSQLADSVALNPDLLFVDTTGELRNFYSAADIIFVGKSLCEHGGQNPIEPAMYGKAVVVGPNMENFPAVMPVFLEEKAILQVDNTAMLEEAIEHLLADANKRAELGCCAANVVNARRGVMHRTVALFTEGISDE